MNIWTEKKMVLRGYANSHGASHNISMECEKNQKL